MLSGKSDYSRVWNVPEGVTGIEWEVAVVDIGGGLQLKELTPDLL